MNRKTKGKMLFAGVITLICTFGSLILEIGSLRVNTVERNGYGKSEKQERYKVTVGDILKKEPLEIEVGEEEYTVEEVRKVFKQTMDKLEKIVLAENESADHVEKNLNLITEMPDFPIKIAWETDKNEIINEQGEIQEKNISSEGDMVEIKGCLSYGEEECMYVMNVMVYPKTLSKKERMLAQIQDKVHFLDKQSKNNSKMPLPAEVSGEKIIWQKEMDYKFLYILLLGGVCMVAIYTREKEEKKKKERERTEQMHIDYPEIISQLALLIGSGMTVKNAWKKMMFQYEKRKEREIRFAYEEMSSTMREMQGGMTEAESYERFGKRCGISSYMKLGTILSQNVRKGSKGLTELLEKETKEALETRRQRAKQYGETAGTKLLLPMSMMLVVVLIIVIVPAFLSISI